MLSKGFVQLETMAKTRCVFGCFVMRQILLLEKLRILKKEISNAPKKNAK